VIDIITDRQAVRIGLRTLLYGKDPVSSGACGGIGRSLALGNLLKPALKRQALRRGPGFEGCRLLVGKINDHADHADSLVL